MERRRKQLMKSLDTCMNEIHEDDEHVDDNQHIDRITWYIRVERGTVSKMKYELRYTNDVECIDEKFKWMKEKYYDFYNTVQDLRPCRNFSKK